MQYKLTNVTYMLRNSHNPTHVVNWTKHMKVLDVCLLKLQMLDLKGGHFIPASESQNVSESNSLCCEKIETIASYCLSVLSLCACVTCFWSRHRARREGISLNGRREGDLEATPCYS